MNATGVLILIMLLAFSADRLTKAILFCLSFVPKWRAYFPDPELIQVKSRKLHIQNRHLIAYTVIVGVIACGTVWYFAEVRLVGKILEGANPLIDAAVTALVIMGGSDLVSRIVQISGVNDTGAAAASGDTSDRHKPIEIVGKLVVENDDRQAAPPTVDPGEPQSA